MIVTTMIFAKDFKNSTNERRENIFFNPEKGLIFFNSGIRGCVVKRKPICQRLAAKPPTIITKENGRSNLNALKMISFNID